MKKYLFYTPVILAFLSAGCIEAVKGVTTYGPSAIKLSAGAAKAAKPVSDIEEYYIGRSVAAKILAFYPVSADEELTQYVSLIGMSIAINSERPETYGGYHFAVLETDELIALACPGGIILVSKGLISLTRNEDEVAAILAHELAHVYHQDGVNAIKSSKWSKVLTIVGSAAAQQLGSEEFAQLAQAFESSIEDVVETLVVKGYSREQEYMADKTAMTLLLNAGYDPAAMKNLLDNYKSVDAREENGILKTHPGTDDRIVAVAKELKSLKADTSGKTLRKARYNNVIN